MPDGARSLDRPPGDARAYVTLVTNADYLPGAVALVRTRCACTGTTADIVVLHTGGVAAAALAPLAALGARLAACELLPTSDAFNAAHSRAETQHARAPFTKGEKPAFHTPLDNFVKLRLWQLPYERVVFLDADTLVLRPIDRLFDYPEFSAAPNVYESLADFRRLNSGVFAARPSAATFAAMLARLDAPGAFWKRTDQTFLQAFFPDWQGLPVYDNLLQYVWFNLPELWDWSLVRVLHFQYEKPWDPANPKATASRPLIALWRAFHDGEGIPPTSPPCRRPLMHVLVTGGTGTVGRFVVPALQAAGHRVTTLGRRPGDHPWDLADPAPRLPPADALVHAALAHVPGAYRGGEGDDPAALPPPEPRRHPAPLRRRRRRPHRLSLQPRRLRRPPPRRDPARDRPARPRLALRRDQARRRGGARPARRRAARHRRLRRPPAQVGRTSSPPTCAASRSPRASPPRSTAPTSPPPSSSSSSRRRPVPFNVSDLLLDRHDLLARVQGADRLPAPAAAPRRGPAPGVMGTDRLRALGWRPGGLPRLDAFLRRGSS